MGTFSRSLLTVAALTAVLPLVTAAPPATLAFTGAPRSLTLNGPYASARVLVEERAGPTVRDATDRATLTIADPTIATLTDGFLRPRRDGATTLLARVGDRTIRLPLTVQKVDGAPTPRFTAHVVPILTRTGCNQGACHGAAQGKGGFKLSLQGYDPEADYEAITRAAAGRRVSPARPESSLLLRKPSGGVPHKGGTIFAPGSPEHRLLTAWIAGGMPAPRADEPAVTAVEITPAVRTLRVGDTQRYQVVARFADGSRRDVTAQTLFSASDGTVAQVATDGQAKVVGRGEAAVLVRYRDRVATASLLSPFNAPRPAPTGPVPPAGAPMIDALIDRKLAALGLDASPPCSDTDFLRRVSLDLTGTLPTPDTVREFVADARPDKRTRLVDTLLESPEYVDNWTLIWGDILRSTRNALGERGLVTMNRWLRDSVGQNKPWDTMSRELVLARGSMFDDGPANFFRAASTPETLAETTSQVFLGVRMQCARCHNHPYEKWRQTQYYQFAAFFARVRTKPGEANDERIVYTDSGGEVNHPKTRQAVEPAVLDGALLAPPDSGDRRIALANWLTAPQNPFFARSVVNRVWRQFLGQGLVEPVDDLRVTNPPANAALLDALAKDFVAHGYDLKALMRAITATRAYQRSALSTRTNAADLRYLSHYPFKRLGAEALLDAVGAATGVPEKFGGYPAGLRATQLPDTTPSSYFLDLFGRPARNVVCQCERTDNPNLGQVLHFMNSKGVNDRLTAKEGRIARLLDAKVSDRELIEEFYLAAFSRFPTDDEQLTAAWELTHAKDRRTAAEDLLWVLLNSKEFVFNH
jgi:hypothetical protein